MWCPMRWHWQPRRTQLCTSCGWSTPTPTRARSNSCSRPARQLTINDIRQVLQSQNTDISAGDFWEGKRRWVVRALGQFRTPEQVEKDSDRDYYMSAAEAKAYGIVDHVVESTREAQNLAVQSADDPFHEPVIGIPRTASLR